MSNYSIKKLKYEYKRVNFKEVLNLAQKLKLEIQHILWQYSIITFNNIKKNVSKIMQNKKIYNNKSELINKRNKKKGKQYIKMSKKIYNKSLVKENKNLNNSYILSYCSTAFSLKQKQIFFLRCYKFYLFLKK